MWASVVDAALTQHHVDQGLGLTMHVDSGISIDQISVIFAPNCGHVVAAWGLVIHLSLPPGVGLLWWFTELTVGVTAVADP